MSKREYPARAIPQHRDHGPHRRGQDHHDRAHPLLHRQDLQDRRGPRGRGGHGPHGPGAGARHHDHVGRDDRVLEGPPDQHHRHARPRRLHDRGRALAARARRRRGRVRLGRRRRAADRDGVASGQQVQRAAHVLRQQDGPHRRQLLPHRGDDRGPAAVHAGGHPAPDRVGGGVRRRHRPGQDEADHLGRRRQGRQVPRGGPRPRPSRPRPSSGATSCSTRCAARTTTCSRST